MSDLARIHLRQARGFLANGNAMRAMELLENAKVLARDNRELLADVLETLVQAAEATGNMDKASRAREALSRLAVPSSGGGGGGGVRAVAAPPSAWGDAVRIQSSGGKKMWPWIVGIAAGVVVIVGVSIALIVATKNDPTVPPITTTTPTPSTPAPAAGAGVQATVATTVPMDFGKTALVQAAVNTTPDQWDRQRLLKDDVAMIVVLCRYEGTFRGGNKKVELPVGTGTAFAVSSDGIMLTNRHVVDSHIGTAREPGAPASLAELGAPTLTLRGTRYLVCFGSQPSEQFEGRVLHSSDKFDLAVVKVNRKFASPLQISTKRMRQADDIYVCGYPGAVTEALNQGNTSSRRKEEIRSQWERTGQLEPMKFFAADAFESTVTKGIVSATERHLERAGPSYLQIDAAVSPGNSGGPVLSPDDKVVGIATAGVRSETGGNYNFALTMDQLTDELDQFLKKPNP